MPNRQAGYYWIQRKDQPPEFAAWSTTYAGLDVGVWLVTGIAGWMPERGVEVLAGPLVYTPPASVHCVEGA